MRIEDLMASASPEKAAESQEPNDVPPGMTRAEPAEQSAYEKVVLAGMKIMYDDKTRDKVLAPLKLNRDTPAKALAAVAQTLITQIDEQSKGTLPETVILPAAGEILEHLAELAQKSGVLKVDEVVLGKAGQIMVLSLAKHYGATEEDAERLLASVPPDQIQGMVEQQAQYDQYEEAEPGMEEGTDDVEEMPDEPAAEEAA